jgi:hypothetical protein
MYSVDMRRPEITRNATSEALVRLRKGMGKTQQTFAVEVLNCAIGSVAKYETNHEPEGDMLDRLTIIAQNAGFHDEARTFMQARIEQMRKKWDEAKLKFPDLIAMPPMHSGERAWGYVFRKLDGGEQIMLEQCCEVHSPAFNSEDPELQKTARDVLTYMLVRTKKLMDPLAFKAMFGRSGEDYIAEHSHPQPQPPARDAPTTTTTQPKRKKKQ